MKSYKHFRHEKHEGLLAEAMEDAPQMHKVPKTHREFKNKVSNKKFH